MSALVHARLPQPTALRLAATAGGLTARVPFGLESFGEEGGVVVPLESSHDVAVVAAALPDPASLPPGTLVVAAPAEPRKRLLGVFGKAAQLSRSVRATALVARGYTGVAAALDAASDRDLVWGYAP
jgi:hypothetical protein